MAQEPLEARQDVGGAERLSVGEAQAVAQPEDVRAPVRTGLGNGGREVPDQLRARRPPGSPQRDKTIVGQVEGERLRGIPHDPWVEAGAAGKARDGDAKRPAAVRALGRQRRHPHVAVEHRERARWFADRDPPGDGAAAAVEPDDRIVPAHGHPHLIAVRRQRNRLSTDPHGGRHRPGPRIDPRHRPVIRVRNPQCARSDGESRRMRCPRPRSG